MANAASWFYIIFSWLTLGVSLFLMGALLNNFFRKRTTGTLILFSSYALVALGGVLGALVYTFQISGFGPTTIGTLQAIVTIAPQVALLIIYMFSCRHILRDNEVVKSLTLMIVSGLLGFITTIFLTGLFGMTNQYPGFINPDPDTNPTKWYQLVHTTIPSTDLYNLAVSGLSVILVLIQIYINLRIIIRAFILSRRTDKIVRKRGLQMIAWGLITYLLAGILISMEIGIEWSSGSHAPTVLWTFRKILFVASYIILYLGWIMPDWFRRRIRGKTWFEMQYKSISKM
ncbi:MAG: hypothetical protein ACTSXA_12495 [Candidatus Heimdallarchaeota archaeon]